MAIQNSDKLLIGRGDTSYHVTFANSGIAKSSDFVLKSGDTMTGTLTIEEVAGQSNSLSMGGVGRVKTRHLDSGNDSNLQIYRDGKRRILIGSDLISFDKLAKYTSSVVITDDSHLTNKKYVDDLVDTKMPKNINTLPLLST